ncbi:M20 family metallopeptidase [Aerococcus sanguinicola]|uniref:M20 family metallopeptidase n=1 Tax=unclassified Aerococcus TaxID=2618060 RepID=UPI0008A28B70|nr:MULTISPECIES: M20 family metallopeptidase [unclassified Aerococcus]MDK6234001.1 M20 family metallopeptidase [Aerococcus sp. UMB10185]MDK6856529.1 M20 family metallopeptidase [Aerococcus sp. UMB7533]MDK8502043.1 M20 family metallopeptidase [Aerococcus sp. UMB1112A]OFN03420.1 hypothetical protein HMPREF2626_05975 [Aerococcus sp. HMSC062A02]OHO45742.1 hypothetical protein HMPREF2705_04080 [Aerococcus sp. HMSC035B07]
MRSEEALKLLQKLIQVNTVEGQEGQALARLIPYLEKLGFDCQTSSYAPGRDQLVASWSSGQPGPRLGLTGHLDVVPSGQEEAWTYPPFAGQIKDGKIYGRGASDMKGGLVALVAAASQLIQAGSIEAGSLHFIITADEESGGKGAEALAQADLVPEVDALICAEPTDSTICTGHRGGLSLKFESFGQAGHAATTSPDQNALSPLLDLALAIRQDFQDQAAELNHPILGQPSLQISCLHAGHKANLVPDSAWMSLDRRTLPQEDHGQILTNYQKMVDQVSADRPYPKIQLSVIANMPALATDPSARLIQASQAAYKQTFNKEAQLAPFFGGTDCVAIASQNPGLEVVIFGPGKTQHQVDEHLDLADFDQAIHFFVELITGYLKQ